MPNITGSSVLYDTEYLIKYLDLSLSAFGIVTNIIHICFLFQNSKIFIFLIFITGADLLHVSTVFFFQIRNVLIYIYHRNCVGYLNYFDMFFKSLVIIFTEFAADSGAWISIFMSFKWSWNHAKKVATWIFLILFIFVSVYCSLIMLIFAYILPYSPCNTEDLAQQFLEDKENPIAQIILIYSNLEFVFGIAQVLANIFLLFIWFPLKFYKFRKHRKLDNFYLENLKCIFSIFLSFMICDFSRFIVLLICYTYGKEDREYQPSQEYLTISNGLSQIIRTTFACLRPFIVLKVCKNYQEIVKAFFIISTGSTSFIKVAPKSSVTTT
ncbi:Protein CBG18567 [Caenorhabditis briggsae]|uniref:Protein CBG18567 n=1 Tax=Caenorhabditis briggsae TaxID=6238 RepID=A8XTL4_CAEBR|nr:Protein CBG18567 [Caenorhabditis briggsae]CAP35991.1 Protein CBG18567 [Caenorhabditis briggsae]